MLGARLGTNDLVPVAVVMGEGLPEVFGLHAPHGGVGLEERGFLTHDQATILDHGDPELEFGVFVGVATTSQLELHTVLVTDFGNSLVDLGPEGDHKGFVDCFGHLKLLYCADYITGHLAIQITSFHS